MSLRRLFREQDCRQGKNRAPIQPRKAFFDRAAEGHPIYSSDTAITLCPSTSCIIYRGLRLLIEGSRQLASGTVPRLSDQRLITPITPSSTLDCVQTSSLALLFFLMNVLITVSTIRKPRDHSPSPERFFHRFLFLILHSVQQLLLNLAPETCILETNCVHFKHNFLSLLLQFIKRVRQI